MQCALVTGASAAAAETAVNDWLTAQNNSGEGIDIKYVAMSEGTIGASLIKVIMSYGAGYPRVYAGEECIRINLLLFCLTNSLTYSTLYV